MFRIFFACVHQNVYFQLFFNNCFQIQSNCYEFAEKKQKYAEDYNKFTIEQLMVCVALAERRLWKFGEERLIRTLRTVDDLMGDVYSGEKTIDDYIAELKITAGIEIRFDK